MVFIKAFTGEYKHQAGLDTRTPGREQRADNEPSFRRTETFREGRSTSEEKMATKDILRDVVRSPAQMIT
jgi:hypothetical protein